MSGKLTFIANVEANSEVDRAVASAVIEAFIREQPWCSKVAVHEWNQREPEAANIPDGRDLDRAPTS